METFRIADVGGVLGVHVLVYFIGAVRRGLKTCSYRRLPLSFDWISHIFREIQSNDHGSPRYEQVFKPLRNYEHQGCYPHTAIVEAIFQWKVFLDCQFLQSYFIEK